MKTSFDFVTLTTILAGRAAAKNIFDERSNTLQAVGRRSERIGSVSPGAASADCAKPVDVELYANSGGSIRFVPDARACRSGRAYVGSSADERRHINLVPSVSGDGSFMASVTDDETGAVYSIAKNDRGETIVTERLQEDYGPELDPEDVMDPSERALLEARLSSPGEEAGGGLRGVAGRLKNQGDRFLSENDSVRSLQDKTVMDVLVLWTTWAECRDWTGTRECGRSPGSADHMRDRINLAIVETNTAYAESGVNAELRLVHSVHTEYVESAGFSPALSDLRSNGDGKIDEAHTLREQYGADIVALIIDDPQYCGIAYLGPSKSAMFSVTAWNCATGYYSFGHEIGHNLGCNHDKGTTNACANSNYNYGWRDPQAAFRSILAYSCRSGQCDNNAGGGCTRVQRFSNPNFLYNDKPIGDAVHDNARKINDVKATVAAYYTATPVTPPPTDSPTLPPPTASPTIPPPTTSPTVPPPTSAPTTANPTVRPTSRPTSPPTQLDCSIYWGGDCKNTPGCDWRGGNGGCVKV